MANNINIFRTLKQIQIKIFLFLLFIHVGDYENLRARNAERVGKRETYFKQTTMIHIAVFL